MVAWNAQTLSAPSGPYCAILFNVLQCDALPSCRKRCKLTVTRVRSKCDHDNGNEAPTFLSIQVILIESGAKKKKIIPRITKHFHREILGTILQNDGSLNQYGHVTGLKNHMQGGIVCRDLACSKNTPSAISLWDIGGMSAEVWNGQQSTKYLLRFTGYVPLESFIPLPSHKQQVLLYTALRTLISWLNSPPSTTTTTTAITATPVM